MLHFSQALDIRPGITSVIGSGGKTTLLRTLAAELSDLAPVLLTTTTHFLPFPECPLIDAAPAAEGNVFGTKNEEAHCTRVLREAERLLSRGHRVVVLGSRMPSRQPLGAPQAKLTLSPVATTPKLAKPALSDFQPLLRVFPYILVEADGSRRLPLKAHAAHEPVIPLGSQQSILMVGASGIGQPLDAVCHRPERYREILSALPTSDRALLCRSSRKPAAHPSAAAPTESSPAALGLVLNREALADCIFLNQLDPLPTMVPGSACIQDTVTGQDWCFTDNQLRIARELQRTSAVPVLFGSLQQHCCCR